MNISDWNITNSNITVVFKTLDKDLIRRDLIRNSFEGLGVVITDIPDAIFMIIPNAKEQASFQERRLIINSVKQDVSESARFLAHTCIGLIKAVNDPEITAYGFNYFGDCLTPDVNINNHLLELCYGDGVNLTKALGSEIITVSPGFSFKMHDALFNVNLNPIESNKVSFKCNIHFESSAIPDEKDLSEKLIRYSELFKEILERF